jgi:hypothetical protein
MPILPVNSGRIAEPYGWLGLRNSLFFKWGQKCAERAVFNEFNDAWPRIFIPIRNANSSSK